MPSAVGRYRIDRVLGSGAFASVWLAHDEVLDAQVAVKVLAGGLLDDLDVRNRFLEEAKILRRADSERLVRVHEFGELDDGRPYFVMSYADLGTLSDRMKKGDLPVAEALRLAVDVALGVEVINRLGVIHRDLKPSNVLFQSTTDGGERLLIADLGLAKALAHASGAFTLPVGTPGYMSPEQARFGGGLDVRADVYGLGALTYHLVTGRAPSTAPVIVRPSEVRRGLPKAIDAIVMRALESDRELRWPTAEAFAEALREPLAALDDDATTPDEAPRIGPSPLETMRDSDRLAALSAEALRASEDDTSRDDDRTVRDSAPDDDRTARDPAPDDEPGNTTTVRVPAPPDDVAGPEDATVRHPHLADKAADTTLVDFRIDQPSGRSELRPADVRPEQERPKPGGRRALVALGLVLVLAVGGGGAYALAKLTGKRAGDGLVTVTDATGRLSLRVPPAWKLQRAHTTWPVAVTDRATAPAMRATPDYDQFVQDDVPTPGVFAGLTHDQRITLPPVTLGSHRAHCTAGPPRTYHHGSLQGQITPWTCGKITIAEVGLRDTGGKFSLWVRIKQAGAPDLTDKILGSVTTKG